MSKKKYPRIGNVRRVRPQGLCFICENNKANARVDFEVNHFRGDDIVKKVHVLCVQSIGMQSLLKTFIELKE